MKQMTTIGEQEPNSSPYAMILLLIILAVALLCFLIWLKRKRITEYLAFKFFCGQCCKLFGKLQRNGIKKDSEEILKGIKCVIYSKKPSGLKNNSTECYMNSVIQALASSDKLIEQFKEIQLKYSKSESLNCFVKLLDGVNTFDDSYKHLCENTDLLEQLIRSIDWTKSSQQDAFELFSAIVNGIHRDFKLYNLENFEMPMKFEMINRFTGINIPNKIQYYVSLSLGLSGKYSTKPGVKIEFLIDQYFQPTIIDDDPNKKSQIFLYRTAPEVLLLHIQANKWDNDRGEMIKPEYHIIYDEKMKLCLNIFDELDNDEIKQITVNYEIKAVVQHMGNIGGGHYVTYRNWNDKWFLVNDEHVESRTFNNDICPYILIYEKY